jgi:hypothetical protein
MEICKTMIDLSSTGVDETMVVTKEVLKPRPIGWQAHT